MSCGCIHEYAAAIRDRYERGNRKERTRILDEFVMATGYHRRSAIRLLKSPPCGQRKATSGGRRGPNHRYQREVVPALRSAWESADWVCSRRLKPLMPKLWEALHRHGELVLAPAVQRQLCAMSRLAEHARLVQRYSYRGNSAP